MSAPSQFQHLADDLWRLSLSELRDFQGVITKIMAAKEEIAAVSETSAEERDRVAAMELKEIRDYLQNEDIALSGPEAVVLAAYCKHQEGSELLDSKGLNIFLDSYGRKPANTSTVVEKLGKRSMVGSRTTGCTLTRSLSLQIWGRMRHGRYCCVLDAEGTRVGLL